MVSGGLWLVIACNSLRTRCPLPQLIGYVLCSIFFVEVGYNEVGFALAERIQVLACLLARFRVSRRYVNCRAILDEAFANHAPDAFGPTCNQDDFALDDCELAHRLAICWRGQEPWLQAHTLTSKSVLLSIFGPNGSTEEKKFKGRVKDRPRYRFHCDRQTSNGFF